MSKSLKKQHNFHSLYFFPLPGATTPQTTCRSAALTRMSTGGAYRPPRETSPHPSKTIFRINLNFNFQNYQLFFFSSDASSPSSPSGRPPRRTTSATCFASSRRPSRPPPSCPLPTRWSSGEVVRPPVSPSSPLRGQFKGGLHA